MRTGLLRLFSCLVVLVQTAVFGRPVDADEPVRLAVFDVDATPPQGASMAYDPVRRQDELTLRCRGIILLGAEHPLVLCAVDWIGIANAGHDAFRSALADAAGTTPNHVAVHCLHQHDAPACDFTAERLLQELDWQGFNRYEGTFHREVIRRASGAVANAIHAAQPVTHWGWGEAIVEQVASNRRILGTDGKVRATRWSATTDDVVRAEPEGTIDPRVTALSFWNGDVPIAVITSYACHPQSYYRTGIPSPDFPGIARFIRGQALPQTLHVHFNGAGGNVTAGKYNDGSHANRMVLAGRLADGMSRAFDATTRRPLLSSDVGWEVVSVVLPPARHLDEAELRARLKAEAPAGAAWGAGQLAWLERSIAGHEIPVSCLRVGSARMLHLPGELFVEYQLAAQQFRPDLHVMMAAYGDGGPGYIGTAVAYSEGGYETGPGASGVDSEAERILTDAIRKLLSDTAAQ